MATANARKSHHLERAQVNRRTAFKHQEKETKLSDCAQNIGKGHHICTSWPEQNPDDDFCDERRAAGEFDKPARQPG